MEQEIFREALESMYEGVLIADASNHVVYANPAYTRITGIDAASVLGTDLADSRPGSHMGAVLDSGEADLGVHRVYQNREHITNIVPIYQDGTLLGGVSVLNSIDDVERLSKLLEKSNDKLHSLEKRIDKAQFTQFSFRDIIAVNDYSVETKGMAEKLAQKDISVLIQGDSGTGKEVYAQAIHNASKRRSYPFVAINCSAISPSLIESELFGYVGGAFTGADRGGRKGIFEAANGGTVFLDEIGEMDIQFQSKLLRLLQERKVRPVGSAKEKEIDVRIITATNQNLLHLINENRFRLDLYYRIAPTVLTLLPLKERVEDIMPLIEKSLESEGIRNKKNLRLGDGVREMLLEYPWPGNVRELTSAISAAAILCENDTITIEDFPKNIRDYCQHDLTARTMTLRDAVRLTEARAIRSALKRYGDTTEGKRAAAKALGISLATLYNKMSALASEL